MSPLIFMPSLYSALHLLVSSRFEIDVITIPNMLIMLVQVSSNGTSSQRIRRIWLYMNMYMHREMHVYTGCVGGLLANTVHGQYSGSHGTSPRFTIPSQRGVTGSGQLHLRARS